MLYVYLNTDDGYFYFSTNEMENIQVDTLLNNEELLGFIDSPLKIRGETPLTLKLLSSLLRKYTSLQFLFPISKDFLEKIDANIKRDFKLINKESNVYNLDVQKNIKEKFEMLLIQKRNIMNITGPHLDFFQDVTMFGCNTRNNGIEVEFDLYALEQLYFTSYLNTPINIRKTFNLINEETLNTENGNVEIKEKEDFSVYDDVSLYESIDAILHSINFIDNTFFDFPEDETSKEISKGEILDFSKYKK